jgi:hypothetical protein
MAQAQKVNVGGRLTGDSAIHRLSVVATARPCYDGLGAQRRGNAQPEMRHDRRPPDFNDMIVGTRGGGQLRKLNGRSLFAFDLQGLDSHATVIPPSPRIDSRRLQPNRSSITGLSCRS